MAATDPVDTTAHIFTEWEVFFIVGYVSEKLGIDPNDDSVNLVALTEAGITEALNTAPKKEE